MREELITTSSIDINVEPSRLWRALTDPAMIKQYLHGTETSTDWKMGSEIIFTGEYEGKKYRDRGIIGEIVENETLTYSYWSGFSGLEDKQENYSLITYNLKPKEQNITTFTWIQKGYADEESYNHSLTGMDAFLKKIKEVAEHEI